jgi:molybdenum cofactor cytidylyltransferase
MRFGVFPLDQAEGAILAHGFRHGQVVLKKGRVLTADDIRLLRAAGVAEITGAKLAPDDVPEDAAAARIAARLVGPGLGLSAAHTGRCNIEAHADGVVLVDGDSITAANLADESVTIATLADKTAVYRGQVVATVKIIPFAVAAATLVRVEGALAAPALALKPFRPRRFALISTLLPTVKDSVISKTETLTAQRVAACGGTLAPPVRCAHATAAVETALRTARDADIVLIAAASATVDRADSVPAGIVAAGGTIEHFGMPVDPGNLLVLARLGRTPVLVLPGCARSPKLNGFDWVLQRLAAGIAVTAEDIKRMGVGGLLVDTPARPLPRESAVRETSAAAPGVAAVVLSAGQSRRMGGDNKLLRPIAGVPLIRRTADAVLATAARPVIVVTGHQEAEIRAALAGLDVVFVHNPRFGEGLSTSLKAGLDAVPAEADGALVCLGDMPAVAAAHIAALIAGFDPAAGRCIGVPTHAGKRGNPTLWARRLFDDMRQVAGDVGARHLIGANESLVYEVEFGDTAVLTDLDTPAQWSDYLSRNSP